MLNRATLSVLALAGAVIVSGSKANRQDACTPEPNDFLGRAAYDACLGFLESSVVVPTPSPSYPRSLRLEANRGQASAMYPLLGRGPGYFLYMNSQETVLDLRPAARVVRLALDGASEGTPLLREEGRVNYFFGQDPAKWLTDVPTYEEMGYRGVYPGIDLVFYAKDGLLEHDFRLAPGADPAQIRWKFRGLDGIDEDGDGLVLRAGEARMRWAAPVAMQGGRKVGVRYRVLGDGTIGFALDNYDVTKPLIIDPVMEYLTYLGRRGGELAGRSAVDTQGNLYIAGATSDPEYPTTPGALSPNGQGFRNSNVVITKMDPKGTRLLYSTYIGGGNDEMAAGVAVDARGAIYITGATNSPDFPTTANAFQRQPAASATGRADRGNCFVVKLNEAGTALTYSTFLSGGERDGCTAIAVDRNGSAYVTGGSESQNYPTTADVVQTRPRLGSGDPRYDVVVTKLTPDGSALAYSTFVGGTGSETGHGIAVDASGNAYVTGVTNSAGSFPVTPGAVRTTYAGHGGSPLFYSIGDAFLFKLNASGTQLVYSTLLGGSRDDSAFALAVDGDGNAYVAGNSLSKDFPVTASAYQREWKGEGGQTLLPGGDAFVLKVNPTGTGLVYSTLLGGSRDDRAVSIALGADNTVHVVGHTLSTDFPVTADAAQATNRSTNWTNPKHTGDGFYARLDANGGRLLYSTYLGGAESDWLSGVAVSQSGIVTVTGNTNSANLPVSNYAYQRTYFGATEQFQPTGDLLVGRFVEAPALAIANAASYTQGSVAPRMIAVIAGGGFGVGTKFLFDGNAAEILYVTERQAGVVVPAAVRGSTVLRVDGLAPLMIPVAAAQPGLFTVNASGTGPGAILNEDGALNTATNPARPGQIVVLYGTGEGAGPVAATIGGRPAEVLYAGPSPALTIGLLQVNVRVPDGTGSGPQPVLIRAGVVESQRGVTVAIAP